MEAVANGKPEMKKRFLPFLIGLAGIAGVLGAFATGESGDAEPNDSDDDVVVLGEIDMAERAEILRNRFRRMTPGNDPLVQDVGVWPAAWEEFGPAWDIAPATRDLATWLVPVTAERSGTQTILRDANGNTLWSGETDFTKQESASVTLTGMLVDEEDWGLYQAVKEEIIRRWDEASRPVFPGMRGPNGPITNGLRFTDISVDTNGDYRLGFAWETNGDVQVFCRAMHYECWTNFGVVYTNDENEVITNDVVNWRQVPGEKFMGIPDYWVSLGVANVTNGEGSFTDTNHANPLFDRVRFYAAAQYADSDNDGITDGEEWLWGITSTTEDSDGDGLSDFLERTVYHTDPYNPDTDGDGWTDGEEVNDEQTDPLDRLSATRLARGVLVHAVKYSGDETNQWMQLHCSGARRVDVSGFRVQAAGTSWQTVATLPANTWMTPGHFLLIGDVGVTNSDLTATLGLAGSYSNQPTAGVRLMAPAGSTNNPVDTMFYGTHIPFNEQGLDTTGWSSYTTNLWAAAGWHLERWILGLDSGRDNDWRYAPNGYLCNSETILDSDGDGLIDETEYLGGLDTFDPDTDGDGLLDGFEKDENLEPTEPDSDFDGTLDGNETDPVTGKTYEEKQEAQGLHLGKPAGLAQGSDIGLNTALPFTLTEINGFGVWGTIWEGGGVAESYTVNVSGATDFWTWERTGWNGHKIVNLFAVPADTNGIVVTVTDGGPNPLVTNTNDYGADIRVAFKAVKLNVVAGGVDEAHEEDPGVLLLDRTVHTNAPLTACRLSIEQPLPRMVPPVEGTLTLDWESAVLNVYAEDDPDGETALADGDVVVPIDGFISTNLWLEAVAQTNTLLEWHWTGQTNGQDWATVNGVSLFLVIVDFSGPKFHGIKQDDGTENYFSVQWYDASNPNDGDADDTNDRKWPVCYTRNTKMAVTAHWKFHPISPSWIIKVKGDGPGNLDFPATNASKGVDSVFITDWECENPFTNAVAYYPSMKIAWSFSVDDGATWLNAGASENTVYVTLGDPLTADLYQTLVHIGCVNAAGKTTESETADAVYSEFTDREVRRVSDNMQMKYWANTNDYALDTQTLLANWEGNGNCQAWSALLRDCFRAQGIPSDRVRARPVSQGERLILVKTWQFNEPGSGNAPYKYRIGVDAINLPGIPGQGNPEPPPAFNMHWITEACGYYFDPSYGTPKVGGTNKEKVYEDSSIDGYVESSKDWCRKNDVSIVSNSEMIYETNN